MATNKRNIIIAGGVLAVLATLGMATYANSDHTSRDKARAARVVEAVATKPVLAVRTTELKSVTLPQYISASGALHAWQNASIGTEVGGLQVVEVRVNVGDKVKKGQVLAVLDDTIVQIDVKQAEASLAEARANLVEARANAQRSRLMAKANAVSEQELLEATTREASAAARVAAAESAKNYQDFRLRKTRIVAPDSGSVSYRNVTEGQVVSSGSELFRYIRGDRVEWQAELSAEQIMRITPGQNVVLVLADKTEVKGKIRQVSPSLNETTRSGIAFVDLEQDPKAKPGMFVSGKVEMGTKEATMVPGSALVSLMGGKFLMTVDDAGLVNAVRVNTGSTSGDMVEVVSGVPEGARFVEKGASLLQNGDHVTVVKE